MRKLLLALAILFITNTANAYVLTPPECRFGKMLLCLKQDRLNYIVIYDGIQTSDYFEIKEIAENLKEGQKFPTVFLQSDGGSAFAGFEIGRIFRKYDVTVRSGNPISGDVYSKCASACVFIAAGATKRHLVHIGLHSPKIHNPKNEDDKITEESFLRIKSYLNEMGMDPRLYEMIKATKNEDMLEIEYAPSLEGKSQYIVQFGFHQGQTLDEDEPNKVEIKYTHRFYGKSSIVFAAMNGSSGALHQLVDLYTYGAEKQQPDDEKALGWLKIGAENDDLISLHNLGFRLEQKKHFKEAIKHYKRAAELGYAGSQNNYGWFLYTGQAGKRNKAEGAYWIVRAAEQGDDFAYGSLCEIYAAGDVFIPNDIEAMKWCRLAVDNMPLGKSRDTAVKLMDKFASKMKSEDVKIANDRVDVWRPLKQMPYTSLDKDYKEDGEKVMKRYF